MIPVLADPIYRPQRSVGSIDRLLLKLIRDRRDLPFLHFMIEATGVVLPLATYCYFGSPSWIVLVLYAPFVIMLYMDRFILILHNTSHRPLFRKQFRFLNYYLVWVLGPLFGESPETYFAHHIGMHHVEGNLEDDLSSTMRFERDNFVHWLRYYFSFFFATIVNLTRYLARHRRSKLLRRFLAGEISYYLFVTAACFLNWQATLVVFALPFVICRTAMIAGNWGQHAFVDRTRPGDPFASAVTVINCRYNRRSFNDGYHIGHHRKSSMHWTDMPGDFLSSLDLYRDQNAIVFEGIDFITVWLLLMLHRYRTLARHFVDLSEHRRPEREIIRLLKSRTRPIE